MDDTFDDVHAVTEAILGILAPFSAGTARIALLSLLREVVRHEARSGQDVATQADLIAEFLKLPEEGSERV